jgi:hypothetical protein
MNQYGSGSLGYAISQNTRQSFGLSAVLSNLAAGTYKVGLCGFSVSPDWNYNEWGYTSALVFQ